MNHFIIIQTVPWHKVISFLSVYLFNLAILCSDKQEQQLGFSHSRPPEWDLHFLLRTGRCPSSPCEEPERL